jgi:hypothetical protein
LKTLISRPTSTLCRGLCSHRDLHITGLFVDPWGAHSTICCISECTNAMGCLENDEVPGKSPERISFWAVGLKKSIDALGLRGPMESMGPIPWAPHAHGAGPGTCALRYWRQISEKTRPGKSDVSHTEKWCLMGIL